RSGTAGCSSAPELPGVPSTMRGDLVSKETVHRSACSCVGCLDSHSAGPRQVFISVRDQPSAFLHHRDSWRDFSVGLKWLVEVAATKFSCDPAQMAANRDNHARILVEA